MAIKTINDLTNAVTAPAAADLVGIWNAALARTDKITVQNLTNRTATGGSSARTLEERFGEIVNVKDHGATGDGSTDDTTAVAAALSAAAGAKPVYFPPGTYVISAVNMADGDRLVGDGPNASIVKHKSSTTTSMLTIATGASARFADICLDGNKAGNSHASGSGNEDKNNVIYGDGVVNLNMAGCRIQNYVRYGVRVIFEGVVMIDGNEFLNGSEHTGTANEDSLAVNLIGYEEPVTASASTDYVTWTGHGLNNGDTVQFRPDTGGTIPTGLTAGTVYYVINRTANTFQVSATSGGAAIDITTDGTLVVAGSANKPSRATVTGNRFEQDDIPATAAYSPGGVLISGMMSSAMISGNTFDRMGQNAATNATGVIDLYTWADQCVISGNRIFNRQYIGLKLQNAGELIVTGNSVGTTNAASAGSGMVISPAQRETGSSNEYQDSKSDIIIQSNILRGAGSSDYILQLNGIEPVSNNVTKFAERIIIADNLISGAGGGMDISEVEGNVLIRGNNVDVDDLKAFILNNVSDYASPPTDGVIIIESNTFKSPSGQHCMDIGTGAGGDIEDINVIVRGNTINCTGGGHHIRILGTSGQQAAYVELSGNMLMSTGRLWDIDYVDHFVNRDNRIFSTSTLHSMLNAGSPIVDNLEIRGNRMIGQTTAESVIAGGVVDLTVMDYMVIDTEGNAATDDLETIQPNGVEGQVIYIRSAATSRTVVLKETGNIKLPGSSDSLLDTDAVATLIYSELTDKWCLVAISDND